MSSKESVEEDGVWRRHHVTWISWYVEGFLSGNTRTGQPFTIKNILMCQHSWYLVGVCVFFPIFSFTLRGPGALQGWISNYVLVCFCMAAAAGHSSVCVFDHCHYQLLSSGWETPTPRPPFLSFHISISFFVLLSPQVTYVRVGGVSADITRRKKGHALVSSISPHLYLSLLQESGRLANQIPSFIHFLT